MSPKTSKRASPPAGKLVKFSLKHATAKSVAVAGSFNAWSMKKHALKNVKGTWTTSLRLKPGRYEYRFVVNGTDWVDDPAASERSGNNIGGQNCVVYVK